MATPIISNAYFKKYRTELGFSKQDLAKDFFGAKDIKPSVDLNYIALLNDRLREIISKINTVVAKEIRLDNLTAFTEEKIDNTFQTMKNNKILPLLNNNGRRPEHVYYNWMRGFLMANYFLKSLAMIFEVDLSKIQLIGDDDLKSAQTFIKTPKADIEIIINENVKIRVEMQSGFQGVNDIKQHKVLEAKRMYNSHKLHTLAIHFDLYNGQVAFVKLDEIEESNENWITRQQMEGQTVFNIDQNYFVWKLTETPGSLHELLKDYNG